MACSHWDSYCKTICIRFLSCWEHSAEFLLASVGGGSFISSIGIGEAGVKKGNHRKRFKRSAFKTTETELKAMAPAENAGVSIPIAASGIPTVL